VVEAFLNMPGPIDNPTPDNIPTDNNLRSIAVRNMVRAGSLGAASGQNVAAEVNKRLGSNYPIYPNERIFPNWNKLSDPDKRAFSDGAPIWLYMMREGYCDPGNGGLTLGLVASRLVYEVITGLIEVDKESYLHYPNWKPRVTTMWGLLNYKLITKRKKTGKKL